MRALLLLLALAAAVCRAAPQVYTPDWAAAATLTAMGHPPLAMGDKPSYKQWVAEPPQPASVIDTGARYRPNRELLAQLPYNLVLDNFFYAHLRGIYPPDVPVVDALFDGGNTEPVQSWQTYVATTRRIGEAVGDRPAANAYLQRVERDLAAWGADIRAAAPAVNSYAVIQFADSRQLRLYAPNSLFRVALDLMGLKLADLGRGDRWGSRVVPLKTLAELPPDSCLIIIAPLSTLTEAGLARSYLWRRMGYGHTRCMRKLPAVWLFGGPDSIHNFARHLHQAMTRP